MHAAQTVEFVFGGAWVPFHIRPYSLLYPLILVLKQAYRTCDVAMWNHADRMEVRHKLPLQAAGLTRGAVGVLGYYDFHVSRRIIDTHRLRFSIGQLDQAGNLACGVLEGEIAGGEPRLDRL